MPCQLANGDRTRNCLKVLARAFALKLRVTWLPARGDIPGVSPTVSKGHGAPPHVRALARDRARGRGGGAGPVSARWDAGRALACMRRRTGQWVGELLLRAGDRMLRH